MFLVNGRINKRNCSFRIDTGSDVTLVRKGLLEYPKQRAFQSRWFNLKYPTGERVPVEFKVRALNMIVYWEAISFQLRILREI